MIQYYSNAENGDQHAQTAFFLWHRHIGCRDVPWYRLETCLCTKLSDRLCHFTLPFGWLACFVPLYACSCRVYSAHHSLARRTATSGAVQWLPVLSLMARKIPLPFLFEAIAPDRPQRQQSVPQGSVSFIGPQALPAGSPARCYCFSALPRRFCSHPCSICSRRRHRYQWSRVQFRAFHSGVQRHLREPTRRQA